MEIPKIPVSRQIAIVGLARSGKTVFLVSLINHILEHEASKFKISDGGGSISKATITKTSGECREFNYEKYRSCISRKYEWPEKTTDRSRITLHFERSDWKRCKLKLHFYDFPGERIADINIYLCDNFDKWSDFMLEYYSNQNYTDDANDYISKVDTQDNPKDIIEAYRKLLWKFYTKSFMPMISPSSFLVDLDGHQIENESDISKRYLGLPPGKNGISQDFAPLTKTQRERDPETAKLFRKNYASYRNKVVRPLFDDLRRSNSLVVLVNIPALLNGGVDRFNDSCEIIKELLEIYDPIKNSVRKKLWRNITLNRTKTDRIAFVASQSDLVRSNDRPKLKNLLKEMTRRLTQRNGSMNFEWYEASAVVSTEPLDFDQCGAHLRGVPQNNNIENKLYEYSVPELPNEWPDEWDPKNYQFPRVWPKMGINRMNAPNHFHLDDIFRFLTK